LKNDALSLDQLIGILRTVPMQKSFYTDASALREAKNQRKSNSSSYLVLFGELFSRGYANGLVDEAARSGFKIVKSTVGRREPDQSLRPLNESEIPTDCDAFINIPLEAGFDMEQDASGLTPLDRLKELGLKDWSAFKWPENSLKQSQEKGEARFRKNVKEYVKELNKIITQGGVEKIKDTQVLFAHLMAGGVPRAKIVMPLMNRVFKGTGDRYMPSTEFWHSPIGEICELSFKEVTAQTLDILIEETTDLREKIENAGGHVSYVAYGYHGTEVWIGSALQWQSYSPYLQGWAKMSLEDVSKKWFKKNVKTCVYNCPEILTNSSSIFQGVEVPLYSLIRIFQKMYPDHGRTHRLIHETTDLLKQPQMLETIYKLLDDFYDDPQVMKTIDFNNWPSHSTRYQLDRLIKVSHEIVNCHANDRKLMVGLMSEIVFNSCGWGMFHDSFAPKEPVRWIGHDFVAFAEVGRN
jgi:hypothetical protein